MRIYDPLYLSTVSSSSATRRIPSAMGLYRVEGGCLYRIKIGRYHTALSREAPLSVHPASERQHQHQRQQHKRPAPATAVVPRAHSRCTSSVTPHLSSIPIPLATLFLHLSPLHSLLLLALPSLFSIPYSLSDFYFPSIPGSIARTTKARG